MSTIPVREAVALQPPTPERIANFPTAVIATSKTLYRCHDAALGPWWFCTDGKCRFDGPPAEFGTCYLSYTREAALRESAGSRLTEFGAFIVGDIAGRVISKLHLPTTTAVADATSNGAADHGVTREIGSVTPYEMPQQWASALYDAGHGGLTYTSRYAPAVSSVCVALFDEPGQHPHDEDPKPMAAEKVARRARITILNRLPKMTLMPLATVTTA